MRVIGLTGGVGSGKSLVAARLAEICKAELLLADDLGHVVMEAPNACYQNIVEHFGKTILDSENKIDRQKLAEIVFHNEVAKKELNAMVHPAVIQYIKDYISERKNQEGTIVLESALLLETNCDIFCHEIWYVHVSKERRIARLMRDRGYTREKCEAIMQNQLSEEVFYEKCQKVIENDGKIEDLDEKILEIL